MAQAPFNLYLDLEPGKVADLVAISRTSIAFAEAVKEVAFVIDPSISIQIGLVSGSEGSLNLETIIKFAQKVKLPIRSKKELAAIALVALTWLGVQLSDYVFEKVMDTIYEKEEFSKEELQQIEAIVKKANDKKVGKPQIELMFRELEKDSSIRGVGATLTLGEPPINIIPRSEFQNLGGYAISEESSILKRTKTDKRRMVLVSPVLLKGSKRKWRFLTEEDSEIAVAILDQSFVDDIASGKISIPMRSGIELEVELQTTEEFHNGVWVTTERKILEVNGAYPRPEQSTLFPPVNPDVSNNSKNEN